MTVKCMKIRYYHCLFREIQHLIQVYYELSSIAFSSLLLGHNHEINKG